MIVRSPPEVLTSFNAPRSNCGNSPAFLRASFLCSESSYHVVHAEEEIVVSLSDRLGCRFFKRSGFGFGGSMWIENANGGLVVKSTCVLKLYYTVEKNLVNHDSTSRAPLSQSLKQVLFPSCNINYLRSLANWRLKIMSQKKIHAHHETRKNLLLLLAGSTPQMLRLMWTPCALEDVRAPMRAANGQTNHVDGHLATRENCVLQPAKSWVWFGQQFSKFSGVFHGLPRFLILKPWTKQASNTEWAWVSWEAAQ